MIRAAILIILIIAGSAIAAPKDPVLRHLDSLCADTWCEGSWQYSFNRIRCGHAGYCHLEYTAKRHDRINKLKCRIAEEHYIDIQGWIEVGAPFDYGFLAETFELEVDRCIELFEKKRKEASNGRTE